jgi:hypothetical protein
MSFSPNFTITPGIVSCLLRIETARQAVLHLPVTPSVLATLRETARLFSTHYSTMIEGNRLTQEQVSRIRALIQLLKSPFFHLSGFPHHKHGR